MTNILPNFVPLFSTNNLVPLGATIEQVFKRGYIHEFIQRPKAWFANGHHHLSVIIDDRLHCVGNDGKEVILLLMRGFGAKGYAIVECNPEKPP